MLSWSHHSYTV